MKYLIRDVDKSEKMIKYNDINNWKNRGHSFNFKSNNIFYISEGKGENLLLIHDYPYNSFEWKGMLDALKEKFTVTIFDLLGIGFSDKPEEHCYSYEEYCEIVNAFMLHLKISSNRHHCTQPGGK